MKKNIFKGAGPEKGSWESSPSELARISLEWLRRDLGSREWDTAQVYRQQSATPWEAWLSPKQRPGSNNHKGQPGVSRKPGSPFSDPTADPWVILPERGHSPRLHVDTGPGGQAEQSVHR